MADEERRQQLTQKLDSLRDDVADVRGELAFSSVVEGATSALGELPGIRAELQRLRARGYAFRPDLEARLAEAEGRASPVLDRIRQEVLLAQSRLQAEAADLVRDVGRLTGDPLRQEGQIRALDGRRQALKQEIQQIKGRLEATAEPLLSATRETKQKAGELHWTLDQFDQATFRLQPEERPIAAARATWEDAPGGDKPKGVLLFSDHRVFFEQKEERVTKRKFIFFTAETETLHKLLIEEPVGHLRESTDSTRGWVMTDQLLTFAWAPQARIRGKSTFELEGGTASDWDAVVELIRSGDLGRYTVADAAASGAASGEVVAGAPPPGAAHRARWPEQCSSCAAPLPAPVKGQTAIACPYCTTDHKVEFVPA